MISAKVIADSSNEFGNRITTMVVTFPRIILAEFNTHRMFSRNSASSRAIPFEKLLKSVNENPFFPIAFQKDHKGMQGTEYFTGNEDFVVRDLWLSAKEQAIKKAMALANYGATKQLCNRLLEPFMWHTVIVTATEWENFFALRCPSYQFAEEVSEDRKFRSKKDLIKIFPLTKDAPDLWWRSINKGQAEIHMMALAEAMWDAYNESQPKQLKAGEWHIPGGTDIEVTDELIKLGREVMDKSVTEISIPKLYASLLIKIATARCARVSYTVVGGEEWKEIENPNRLEIGDIIKHGDKVEIEITSLDEKFLIDNEVDALLNNFGCKLFRKKSQNHDYQKDIELHDRLAKSGHWSPFEHCARAMNENEFWKASEQKLHPIGYGSKSNGWSGNFRGFIQYRKMFENENITK